MRRIVAGLFVSLDGVVEAPETWHFPYMNDEMGAASVVSPDKGPTPAANPSPLQRALFALRKVRGKLDELEAKIRRCMDGDEDYLREALVAPYRREHATWKKELDEL